MTADSLSDAQELALLATVRAHTKSVRKEVTVVTFATEYSPEVLLEAHRIALSWRHGNDEVSASALTAAWLLSSAFEVASRRRLG